MSSSTCWLLPVLDGARFLDHTLASIAAQSVAPGQILAWDNGSRDGSVEILRRWIPDRIPGRVVSDHHIANLGGCLAEMVNEANSEIVVRIDADDINHPRRLEKELSALEREPELVGVGSTTRPIDPEGLPVGPAAARPTDPRDVRLGLLFGNQISHPTVALRRAAVLRAGNYRPLEMGQDYDLWYRLTALGGVRILPTPLLDYRVHPGSVSATRRGEWRDLHLELLRRYGGAVAPKVPWSDLLRVWHRLSSLGDQPPGEVATGEILIRLARAAACVPAWRHRDFLATPWFGAWYRRCTPRWRPRTWLRRVQLGLHRAGLAMPHRSAGRRS